jgi:tryptophan-rich sensory protein
VLSFNAVLYTVVFAVIAYGASTIWSQAPLGQRVHLAAILLNSLTFIAGAWSPTAVFVEGRNPRLVGWAVGLSVVLVAMAIVARYQRLPKPWYRPLRSASLAAVPLIAFVAALAALARAAA